MTITEFLMKSGKRVSSLNQKDLDAFYIEQGIDRKKNNMHSLRRIQTVNLYKSYLNKK